jgi:hypothetical protein
MMGAKRFRVREELDSFEPVGLSLSIVAVEDVNSRREINLAFEIPEALNFD